MKEIFIYDKGTRVETKIGKFQGFIVAAEIRYPCITYEVSYFAGGEQKTMELDECEFDVIGKESKIKVGFIK